LPSSHPHALRFVSIGGGGDPSVGLSTLTGMDYPGSDVSLVTAAIAGDEDALQALISECLPHVITWSVRLCGMAADGEDCAHEAMIIVLRRLPELREPEAFPYWLFGITRNVVRNQRRKAWFRRWLPGFVPDRPDPTPSPALRLATSQRARRVAELLDRLPEAQRVVLILCDLEDRSASEAARLLGVPVGTVKSRLRLGRKRFVKEAELMDALDDLGQTVGAAG
jgi:RNA polymerase sigma-70 factor, ECF subfamily